MISKFCCRSLSGLGCRQNNKPNPHKDTNAIKSLTSGFSGQSKGNENQYTSPNKSDSCGTHKSLFTIPENEVAEGKDNTPHNTTICLVEFEMIKNL